MINTQIDHKLKDKTVIGVLLVPILSLVFRYYILCILHNPIMMSRDMDSTPMSKGSPRFQSSMFLLKCY